ncbi:MAG: nicotinamide riboside transporter PnuC [Bacteroidia bacterium]|nr:nicotinamide riboside transporter PnuC [Bacteroidia bacterium]
MDLKLILQIVGLILGLLYLWLEYKANIWLWLIGIIMPIVHGTLYFTSGLYADAAMNVYYVVAGLYGWFIWSKKSNKTGAEVIRIGHTLLKKIVPLVLAYVIAHVCIYFVLVNYTDSTVPFCDSLTTALSIVALWMLSRKYIEQWLVWLVVDAITVGLYLYKGIPITAGLYTLYTCMALAGYFRWRRMAEKNA